MDLLLKNVRVVRPGGDGITKQVEFTTAVQLGWVADRSRHGPWGLAGGGDGATGRARVRRAGETGWVELPPRAAVELRAGSEIAIDTPGGGGHGAAAAEPG